MNVVGATAATVYTLTGTNANINVSYFLESESSVSSNSDLTTATNSAIYLLLTNFVAAFLGPNSSSTSKAVSPLATVFGLPHISYAATSSELSNKATYPNFFRTTPEDSGQAAAMVAFVTYVGWKKICVVNSLDTYGSTGAASLVSKAVTAGLSVATQQEFFPGETNTNILQTALEKVKKTRVRVVVVFALSGDTKRILEQAVALGMYGPDWVWISSDGFSGESFSPTFAPIAPGFIAFNPLSTYTNQQYTNFAQNWNSTYNRPGGIITGFRGISYSASSPPSSYSSYGTSLNSYAYFAYDAMKILLTAIESLALEGRNPCDDSISNYRKNLTEKLKVSSTNGISGVVSFNGNQDRDIAEYDLRNYGYYGSGVTATTSWKKIATWSSIDGFVFENGLSSSSSPYWSNGQTGIESAPSGEETPPTFNYSNTRMAYPCLAGFLIFMVIILMSLTYFWRKEPRIKAASPNIMQIINIGCILLFVCVIVGYPHPTAAYCQSQPSLGHLGFAFVFGPLFAKNRRIKHIFLDQVQDSSNLSDLGILAPVVGLVVVVSLYILLWFVLDPPLPHEEYNKGEDAIILVCKSRSQLWYYVIMIFELSFLLYGVYLAFLLRNVEDRFNESKEISMSLYCAVFIFIIFVILFAGLEFNPDQGYAVFSSGILITFLSIECLLYGPRIYGILLNVEESSKSARESYKGETTSHMRAIGRREQDIKVEFSSMINPELSGISGTTTASESRDNTLQMFKTLKLAGLAAEKKNKDLSEKIVDFELKLQMARKKEKELKDTIIKLMEERLESNVDESMDAAVIKGGGVTASRHQQIV
eukprot:jgi/Bigna1/77411/fgenesh1_pg.47_\